METAEVRPTVEELIGSVWAFSTICFAVETGILEHLDEPRTLDYASEHSGVPVALVERILDVLVALSLVRREGDAYAADKALLPAVTAPRRTFFLGNLKSNYFESRDLIDSAKNPTMALGWSFTEPEILQTQGTVSSLLAGSMLAEVVPGLGDLASRLQEPSPKFLDVGTGVGAISIALCRLLPNLHAVGLEPQDAPLAEARRNIAAAALNDRIELRKQGIEDMADQEMFDLAFFPQSFMSDDVVARGLQNIWRALRPGGWVLVSTLCVPGTDLQAALLRLRDTLWGGSARIPSQVEAMLGDAGFTSVRTSATSVAAFLQCVAGQRPI